MKQKTNIFEEADSKAPVANEQGNAASLINRPIC